MRELNECLQIAKEIKEKRDLIKELEAKAMSPKNQIITDMPKGGGAPQNELERYVIKKERINSIIADLKALQKEKWETVLSSLAACDIADCDMVEMLELRFVFGHSWKKCAAIMNERYPFCKWNNNKCFRVYRYVLNKLHKNIA